MVASEAPRPEIPGPTRLFALADQQAFAALSGDHNPMHLDMQAARRLMLGGVAVHGIHLVLWALESLLAAGVEMPALATLRARFDRPAALNQRVRLDWRMAAGKITLTIQGDAGRLMRLSVQPAPAGVAERWEGAREVPPVACAAHDMADLAMAAGNLELALPAQFATMFPHLAAGFAPRQVAILLASTRLVGMICPGLHSIYAGLSLAFTLTDAPSPTLEYAVTRADARVRLVDIALTAPDLRGTLETLLRPEPVVQPGFDALRALVPPGSFAGQRALVIGGARGLGELTAKLLALGGAEVTFTYLHGADDAARLVAAAVAAGVRMCAQRFDIAAPPVDMAAPPGGFTHAYYFATPRITPGPDQGFSATALALYLDYYVTGLARCLEWLRPRAVADLVIWYPSTIFIDQPSPGLAEYAAAKACGEALCAQLTAHLAPLRVVAERLPRLATDQTQSLTQQSLEDGVAILRAVLLRLASTDLRGSA